MAEESRDPRSEEELEAEAEARFAHGKAMKEEIYAIVRRYQEEGMEIHQAEIEVSAIWVCLMMESRRDLGDTWEYRKAALRRRAASIPDVIEKTIAATERMAAQKGCDPVTL